MNYFERNNKELELENLKFHFAKKTKKQFERIISSRHRDIVENIWILAMEKGMPPYTKVMSKNYIRINLSAFIVHIQEYLYEDLSNFYSAIEQAIFRLENHQFSLKKDILFAGISLAKILIHREILDESVYSKLSKIKLKRITEAKQPSLTREDFDKLLKVIEDYPHKYQYSKALDFTIANIAWFSSMRISEICNLDLSDIDLKENRIYIRNSKNNKSRTIGINKNLKPILEEYISKSRKESQSNKLFILNNASPLNVSVAQKRFKKLFDKAGLASGFHQFRRGSITSMIDSSMALPHIQYIVGHNSLSVTMNYYKGNKDLMITNHINWVG